MSIDDMYSIPYEEDYWKKELEKMSAVAGTITTTGGSSTIKPSVYPKYGTEPLRTLNTDEVKFIKDILLIILPKAEEKDYVKICRIVTKLDDMLP